jgi:hypothetical protein
VVVSVTTSWRFLASISFRIASATSMAPAALHPVPAQRKMWCGVSTVVSLRNVQYVPNSSMFLKGN